MTVSALYNSLFLLSVLFDHNVMLFSSVKIIKWDVTLSHKMLILEN